MACISSLCFLSKQFSEIYKQDYKTISLLCIHIYMSIWSTRFYMQVPFPKSILLFFSDMLIKLFSNTDQIGGKKHPIFILQRKAFCVLFSNNLYLDPELVIHFWGKRLSKLRGNHSATRRTVYWNYSYQWEIKKSIKKRTISWIENFFIILLEKM